jgi:ribosomal protein S18 acetylase RimI-like enzyme
MELFRDPAHPGTGRALLERALQRAAAAGLPALGLAVTDGNPAARLYEAVGFRRVLSSRSVDL